MLVSNDMAWEVSLMKKLLIVLISIAVLVVVIAVVAIPVVNKQASTMLSDTLKDQIALQGLEETLTYDSIMVDSTHGTVSVQGITVQNIPNVSKVTIDTVMATIPVMEIISFARSPEEGIISDVHLTISGVGMAMSVEGADFLLDLGTSEIQVNGRLDMDFIENILSGTVDPKLPQVETVSLSVDRVNLNSTSATLSFDSLLSEIGTIQNAQNEAVRNFQVSMNNIQLDSDTGSENTNTLFVKRYETQVQGEAVLDMLAGLATGTLEIDTSRIDSMDITVEGGELQTQGEGHVRLETLTAGIEIIQNADKQKTGLFHTAMSEVEVGIGEDEEKISLDLGRYETRIQGQVVLQFVDSLVTDHAPTDRIQVEIIAIDMEKAKLVAPKLSMGVGSFTAQLDGVDSVLAMMEPNSDTPAKFSSTMQLANYTLALDKRLLDEVLADVEMRLGPLAFLRDPESLNIDNFQMELSLENEKAELTNLALNTDWLGISGSSSIGISKDMTPSPPFEADLKVAKYPEALRPLLEITAFMLGTELPKENSFAIQINDGSILWGDI